MVKANATLLEEAKYKSDINNDFKVRQPFRRAETIRWGTP
jgi:hypothetical protein